MQISMAEKDSKMVDKHSKERPVSISAEARDLLWQVGGPPRITDNRKSWLARLARELGFGQRRTKAIFYCEARVITADEWRTLNQRLDALKAAERRHGEELNEYRKSAGMAEQDRFRAV